MHRKPRRPLPPVHPSAPLRWIHLSSTVIEVFLCIGHVLALVEFTSHHFIGLVS